MFDAGFADSTGVSVIAQSAIDKALTDAAERIRRLIDLTNEQYSRNKGEDLFKATNKTANGLASLGGLRAHWPLGQFRSRLRT